MNTKELSVEEGIAIQDRHLEGWKTILKEEVYEALEEYAKRTNHEARTGYDIRRGNVLDNYIGNYMLGHRF
jgi:hypothetical protein